MSRRKARTLAVQAIFSYTNGENPLDVVLQFHWDVNDDNLNTAQTDESQNPTESEEQAVLNKQATYDFARLLVNGTVNHLGEIDNLIKAHLDASWSMDRVNKVAVAVLRVAIFELAFQKDLSTAIIIDEAVRIAKDLGAEETYAFINGILDKINKEIIR